MSSIPCRYARHLLFLSFSDPMGKNKSMYKDMNMYSNNAYQRGIIFKNISLIALVIVIIGNIVVYSMGWRYNMIIEYILYTSIPTVVTVGLLWVLYARIGYYLLLLSTIVLFRGFSIRLETVELASLRDGLFITYTAIVLLAIGIIFAIYGKRILYLTFTKIKFIY